MCCRDRLRELCIRKVVNPGLVVFGGHAAPRVELRGRHVVEATVDGRFRDRSRQVHALLPGGREAGKYV